MLLTYTGTAVANAIRNVYLNDPTGRVYTDARLLPIIIEVFEDLIDELVEIDAPVTYFTSFAAITYLAGATEVPNADININLRIIEPSAVWERPTSSSNVNDFVKLTRWDRLPIRTQEETLRDWAWAQDKVLVIGATTNRSLRLEYSTYPLPPAAIGDTISIANSKQYMILRVASIAAFTIGQSESMGAALNTLATAAKETMFNKITKAGQWKPMRRPAYRRPMRRISTGGARS